MKGFKDFLMRGNVVDLAVAFVIGLAVVALIGSIVDGLINPLIAAVFGEPDLTSVGTFEINNAQFSLGLILTALINFLAVAAVVYFLIVLPMNKIKERMAKPEEAAAPTEVELLIEIRDSLRAGGGPQGDYSRPTGP
jgi:large conductance mechanosensitive channel